MSEPLTNKQKLAIEAQTMGGSLVWGSASTTLDEAALDAMASAGQALAVQWGHEPWSDSWAHLVAKTLLSALRDVEEPSGGDAHS